MRLRDILRKVGGAVVREAIPGGGLILDAIGWHSDPDVTGDKLAAELRTRPEIMEREFDVREEQIKQEGETLRAMLAADAQSTHTTRPYIAKHSFHVLAIVSVAIVAALLLAVGKSSDPLQSLNNAWPLVLSVVAPFVMLLRAYFGLLSREHKNRLDSAQGASNPDGLVGLITNMFNRRTKP